MYKNQLQELAQRSCFNLPSYTSIREGPDHAPRFKAAVNFNGEVFECPAFVSTLRQAEHNAAEAALHALSSRGPSHSLAARILDETGVYKNLLQETSQRVGAPLPSYTTSRSGLGHHPVFSCTVELAGIEFTGEPAKSKKQAEKNAAMAAWSSLKQLAKEAATSTSEPENNDEQEQITIARALLNYRLKEKMAMANDPYATPFPKKFNTRPDSKPSPVQVPPVTASKILPLIQPKYSTRARAPSESSHSHSGQLNKFAAAGAAATYIPVRHYSMPYHGGMAPSVTIRTAVPVFSAPPLPSTGRHLPPVMNPPVRMASPVRIRPAVRHMPAYPPPRSSQTASSVIPIQLRERPSPAVAVQRPPSVAVSLDPPAKLPPNASALLETPVVPEVPPVSVRPPVETEKVADSPIDGIDSSALVRLEQLEI